MRVGKTAREDTMVQGAQDMCSKAKLTVLSFSCVMKTSGLRAEEERI